MILETARLRLVPWKPQDYLALIEEYDAFAASFGAPAANGMRDFLFSEEVSPAWLAALRESYEADPWRFGFALVEQPSQLVVGAVGFKGAPDEQGVVEIAYGLAPGYQGRGLAREAAAEVIRFAEADPRVRIVRAHTRPENNASANVLKKSGFQWLGEVTDPEDGQVWRWERPAVR